MLEDLFTCGHGFCAVIIENCEIFKGKKNLNFQECKQPNVQDENIVHTKTNWC